MPIDLYALSLDIGGSHATAAAVHLRRREVLEDSVTRCSVDPDALADDLADAWAGVVVRAYDAAERPPVLRLGVAMPGPFDYASGVSLVAHKFASLFGRSVRDALRERLSAAKVDVARIRFANEGALFTLGEWWAGSASGHDRVLGVTLGTGLGSGYVHHGRIAEDGDPAARAELWCTPHEQGFAEDYVSTRGVRAAYAARTGVELEPREIAERARAGDLAAEETFREMGRRLGAILAPSVAALRPGCVVVGGGIARAWALFGDALVTALGPSAPTVVPGSLGDLAHLLGAAALT